MLLTQKMFLTQIFFESFLYILRANIFGRVKFVTDSNEHKAFGSTREKLTFAMRECCLLLLCATVVIAATVAHVGLFLLLLLSCVRTPIAFTPERIVVGF